MDIVRVVGLRDFSDVAALGIHDENAKDRFVELGGHGDTPAVRTPERLLPVSFLRDGACVGAVFGRKPYLKRTVAVVDGKRKRASVRRPPWLASFARPMGDLLRISAVGPHGPGIDLIAALLREIGDQVTR